MGRLANALRDAANPQWALAYWRARNARIPTERRPGAVVAMDDIWTPAIFDFAEEVGETVAIASWDEHSDGVGLLRKT